MAKKNKKEETPKIKAYVIMSQHFEYDDNYNNAQDGGNPVKVYLNKDKAKEEATRKNIAEICGCNIDDYSYSIREDEGSLEMLKGAVKRAKGKVTDDGDGCNVRVSLPETVTVEQVDEILGILGVNFHTVEEVDVDVDI
jgi:hypothetical protein